VVRSSKLKGVTPTGDAGFEFVSGAAGDTYDPTDGWGAFSLSARSLSANEKAHHLPVVARGESITRSWL
jgi:hypothetical protein